MIRALKLDTLTAAGTSVTYDVIDGELLALYAAFDSAGTLTVTTQHAPTTTFLTLTAAGTQWYYPRAQVHSTAGAGLTYDGTRILETAIPFVDNVQMVTDAAGTAAVTLIVRV